MTTVRVVAGTGTGPTTTAAYDAALYACGLGRYNLLKVSSVIPADATVETPDRLPNLGPVGGVLTTVQARADVSGTDAGAAALGWVMGPEGGLFYEAGTSGGASQERARTAVKRGLEAGVTRRDWELGDPTVVQAHVEPGEDPHACAVVAAVYGRTEPPAKGF